VEVAILGAGSGWHVAELERALEARGHGAHVLPVSALVAHIGAGRRLDAGGVALQEIDAVLQRLIPKVSLEKIIFRIDALHWLEHLGIAVMNSATAIERTVDKFYTSALLEAEGLPTPRTVVAERMEDAMTAFRALRDVIVKPLFGSGGRGMVRVLQEVLPHEGRDVRVFVVGDRVVAAAWRCAEGWRTNVAQGARVERASLPREWHDLSVRATRAVAAEYAGVDLLPMPDGRVFVLEVNGIPGWQALQSVTDVDVAAAIVEHLETVARRAPGPRF
jgi:glutathione synthase/RimK-type ligase-like ATP-grasp enzyme